MWSPDENKLRAVTIIIGKNKGYGQIERHPSPPPPPPPKRKSSRVSDMPCSIRLGQRRVWVLVFV